MTAVALELGYIIAIPLVGFALLGRYLDTWSGLSPLFLLLGMLLAIASSSIVIYRKISVLLKEADNSKIKKD